MRRRDSIGVFLAIGVCAAILGGIPLYFLVYGGLGSAVLGLGLIGGLILIQYLLFLPLWRRLRNERATCVEESNSDAVESTGGRVRSPDC